MSWLANIKDAISIAEPGTSIVKTAVDIAERGKALLSKPDPDTMVLKLHIAELQQELVASKQAYMAVYDALLDLKRKAEQAERFGREKSRYTMTKTDMGAYVYTLRPEHAGSEPVHDLCAACFEDEVKSVLQPVNFNTLGCGRCGGRFLKSDGQEKVMMVRTGRGLRTGFNVLDPYGDDD